MGKTSLPSIILAVPSPGTSLFPRRLQDQRPLSGPSPLHGSTQLPQASPDPSAATAAPATEICTHVNHDTYSFCQFTKNRQESENPPLPSEPQVSRLKGQGPGDIKTSLLILCCGLYNICQSLPFPAKDIQSQHLYQDPQEKPLTPPNRAEPTKASWPISPNT